MRELLQIAQKLVEFSVTDLKLVCFLLSPCAHVFSVNYWKSSFLNKVVFTSSCLDFFFNRVKDCMPCFFKLVEMLVNRPRRKTWLIFLRHLSNRNNFNLFKLLKNILHELSCSFELFRYFVSPCLFVSLLFIKIIFYKFSIDFNKKRKPVDKLLDWIVF